MKIAILSDGVCQFFFWKSAGIVLGYDSSLFVISQWNWELTATIMKAEVEHSTANQLFWEYWETSPSIRKLKLCWYVSLSYLCLNPANIWAGSLLKHPAFPSWESVDWRASLDFSCELHCSIFSYDWSLVLWLLVSDLPNSPCCLLFFLNISLSS